MYDVKVLFNTKKQAKKLQPEYKSPKPVKERKKMNEEKKEPQNKAKQEER